MLILNRKDIQSIFSMSDAIDAVANALLHQTSQHTYVPLRTVIDINKQDAQSLFMPAYIDGLDALGIKVVSVFPGKSVTGQMLLMDSYTGQLSAIIDGTYLTELRTGALQGLATKLLSNQDAKTAVLIGTGGQAKAQLEAMLAVRKLELVKVFDINFEKAKTFVKEMKQIFSHLNTTIEAFSDVTQAIAEADIITAVTTAKKPVFDGSMIKKGAHINGLGAYRPDMQELPETIIHKANKIYFDTWSGVLAEAGDILMPLQQGLVTQDDFSGELSDILKGYKIGRESTQEITVFKAVGSAILDVVTAVHIYKKAQLANIGTTIEI